ncbi:hypothetical protein IL54_3350 [Sphingobium sp. ba1]|nr:hypothetical protein IL54_3350 [Sphingobium sp. ba1]
MLPLRCATPRLLADNRQKAFQRPDRSLSDLKTRNRVAAHSGTSAQFRY